MSRNVPDRDIRLRWHHLHTYGGGETKASERRRIIPDAKFATEAIEIHECILDVN